MCGMTHGQENSYYTTKYNSKIEWEPASEMTQGSVASSSVAYGHLPQLVMNFCSVFGRRHNTLRQRTWATVTNLSGLLIQMASTQSKQHIVFQEKEQSQLLGLTSFGIPLQSQSTPSYCCLLPVMHYRHKITFCLWKNTSKCTFCNSDYLMHTITANSNHQKVPRIPPNAQYPPSASTNQIIFLHA